MSDNAQDANDQEGVQPADATVDSSTQTAEAADVQSQSIRGAFSSAIRKRPLSSVIVTSLVTLLLGLGAGFAFSHDGHRPIGGPGGGFGMHQRDGRGHDAWRNGPMMGPNGPMGGNGPMMGPGQGFDPDQDQRGPGWGPRPDRSDFPAPSTAPQNQ